MESRTITSKSKQEDATLRRRTQSALVGQQGNWADRYEFNRYTHCYVEVLGIAKYSHDSLRLCLHVHLLYLTIIQIVFLGSALRRVYILVRALSFSESRVKSRFRCLHRRSGERSLRGHNVLWVGGVCKIAGSACARLVLEAERENGSCRER